MDKRSLAYRRTAGSQVIYIGCVTLSDGSRLHCVTHDLSAVRASLVGEVRLVKGK